MRFFRFFGRPEREPSEPVSPAPKELYVPRPEIRQELQHLLSQFRQKRSTDPIALYQQWHRDMAVDQVLIYAEQQDVAEISICTGDTEVLPMNPDTIDRLIAASKHAYIRAVQFGQTKNSNLMQALARRRNISIVTADLPDKNFQNSHFIAAGNAYAMTVHQPFYEDPESPLNYDDIGMRLTFNDPAGAEKLHNHVKTARETLRGRI